MPECPKSDRSSSILAPTLFPAPPIIPGGVLAFVPIAPGLHDPSLSLPRAEQELASTVSPALRDAFVAGRVALRAAMDSVAPMHRNAPLLRTARGAPLLPVGYAGSVSHKRTRAVALAAPGDDAWVGVDLERRPALDGVTASENGRTLAKRILTAAEQVDIAGLDGVAQRDATLLYFALKEAVYKAIDPLVQRYVRFTEVEIRIEREAHGQHAHDSTRVSLLLPECERVPLTAVVAWQRDPEWIVAVASLRRA